VAANIGSQKHRLKTFFSGWVASEAITGGWVDLLPSRFSRIPYLIESGKIGVDAAFVQVSPPNEAGFSSLGVAVDAARQAMARADWVAVEINADLPYTFGDTFVHLDEFDFVVASQDPPFAFQRRPVNTLRKNQLASSDRSDLSDASDATEHERMVP